MPLGPARGEKAPISKTRQIHLEGLELRLSPEEIEKGVATLTFLPSRIKTTSPRHPRFHITDQTLDRVYTAMNSVANKMPMLYAHGKSLAHGLIAAAWTQKLSREKDRIAVEVKFTKRALKEIQDGDWGYLSPGIDVRELPDGSLEPVDGFELSLTNTPMIDEQQRIAADRDGGIMDTKKLAKLAGVAEDSSEDAILEALGKKLTPEKPTAGAGELPEAQLAVLADHLEARLTKGILERAGTTAEKMIEADRKEHRVEMLLERAMKNGKAVAADRKATVAGKEVDPLRIFCEAHPDAFEQWEKNAVKKAPVAGAFPKGDGQDAVTRTEAGSFAEADLTNPEVRMELHRAAEHLVAAKKATDYEAATLTLTRAQ